VQQRNHGIPTAKGEKSDLEEGEKQAQIFFHVQSSAVLSMMPPLYHTSLKTSTAFSRKSLAAAFEPPWQLLLPWFLSVPGVLCQ
jgi:hypothetical protein